MIRIVCLLWSWWTWQFWSSLPPLLTQPATHHPQDEAKEHLQQLLPLHSFIYSEFFPQTRQEEVIADRVVSVDHREVHAKFLLENPVQLLRRQVDLLRLQHDSQLGEGNDALLLCVALFKEQSKLILFLE